MPHIALRKTPCGLPRRGPTELRQYYRRRLWGDGPLARLAAWIKWLFQQRRETGSRRGRLRDEPANLDIGDAVTTVFLCRVEEDIENAPGPGVLPYLGGPVAPGQIGTAERLSEFDRRESDETRRICHRRWGWCGGGCGPGLFGGYDGFWGRLNDRQDRGYSRFVRRHGRLGVSCGWRGRASAQGEQNCPDANMPDEVALPPP